VEDAAVGSAEVAGDVSALLLTADDAERGDFLEGGAEEFVEVLTHLRVGQCVHTERLGVVSGEARVFKVTGDVQHEDQLLFLLGVPGGLARRVVELDAGVE
jgi:hypothetical protein